MKRRVALSLFNFSEKAKQIDIFFVFYCCFFITRYHFLIFLKNFPQKLDFLLKYLHSRLVISSPSNSSLNFQTNHHFLIFFPKILQNQCFGFFYTSVCLFVVMHRILCRCQHQKIRYQFGVMLSIDGLEDEYSFWEIDHTIVASSLDEEGSGVGIVELSNSRVKFAWEIDCFQSLLEEMMYSGIFPSNLVPFHIALEEATGNISIHLYLKQLRMKRDASPFPTALDQTFPQSNNLLVFLPPKHHSKTILI